MIDLTAIWQAVSNTVSTRRNGISHCRGIYMYTYNARHVDDLSGTRCSIRFCRRPFA